MFVPISIIWTAFITQEYRLIYTVELVWSEKLNYYLILNDITRHLYIHFNSHCFFFPFCSQHFYFQPFFVFIIHSVVLYQQNVVHWSENIDILFVINKLLLVTLHLFVNSRWAEQKWYLFTGLGILFHIYYQTLCIVKYKVNKNWIGNNFVSSR